MTDKYFAVVLRLQEPLITEHCFGDCGKALIAGLMDDMLGALIPCATEQCPHLDKQMDKPLGTAFHDAPVFLRKLK